jgi:hemerythrin
MKNNSFIEWETRHAIGIGLIDEQHQKLIDITNQLFEGCLLGNETAARHFKIAIRQAVDYARHHFLTEEILMETIKYPGIEQHRKEHAEFIKEILKRTRDFEEGKLFVPNSLVRYLRDWFMTHVALFDKKYAEYIMNLRKAKTDTTDSTSRTLRGEKAGCCPTGV